MYPKKSRLEEAKGGMEARIDWARRCSGLGQGMRDTISEGVARNGGLSRCAGGMGAQRVGAQQALATVRRRAEICEASSHGR
jgi:hypothetical protein